MNTQSKKSTQIFQGILSGIGIWIVGHLMSGRLAFVENIELYPTGPLVFAFPLVFAIACILIAKYAVKANKGTYFKSSIICFSLPALCWAVCNLLAVIMELKVPAISFVADILALIFTFPCVAMLSIYWQFLDVIGNDIDGIKMFFVSFIFIIPMIIGVLVSLKIYKDNS